MEEKQQITYEPPLELNDETVIKWSEHYKMLEVMEINGEMKTHSIRSKAKKFLQHDCIEWDFDEKVWLCKPLENYNKTTYHITQTEKGNFECSCQFFQSTCKDNNEHPELICSHILALLLFLKIKNWKYHRHKLIDEEMI